MEEDVFTGRFDVSLWRKILVFARPFRKHLTGLVLLGLWLIAGYAWEAYSSSPWLHAKLALVVVLIGYHAVCGAFVGTFARRANARSHKFYRLFNELPVFLLAAIVVLVVVKPWS